MGAIDWCGMCGVMPRWGDSNFCKTCWPFDGKHVPVKNRATARKRPGWEHYAIDLADTAARQSQDPWVQVGACVLRPDNSVAGLGFNGAPPGVDIDWSDRDARRPLVVHAEQNALRFCQPQDVAGGLVAVTHRPCVSCTAIIASYKIKRVVYLHENDASNYDETELRRVAAAFDMTIYRLS